MLRSPFDLRAVRHHVRIVGVVFMLLLTACAYRPANDQIAGNTADIQATQDRLNNLLQRIEGTREDRLAAELITYRLYQDGLVKCMAAQGFTYRPPEFVDPTLALPFPIVLNTEWLDPLSADYGLPAQARAITLEGQAQTAADSAETPYLSLTPDGRDQFEKALDGVCSTSDVSQISATYFPDGFDELRTDFQVLLTSISDKLARYGAGYSQCMSSRGMTFDSRLEMYYGLVYAEPPYPDGSDQDAVKVWNDWATEVQANASADAVCRRDAYEAGMTELAPLLENFESENQSEIQHVVEGWSYMVEQASGYSEFSKALQVAQPTWPDWDGMAPRLTRGDVP